MRDNEYTSQVLQAFRARFTHLNSNDAFPCEDVSQMVNRVAVSEDSVYSEGFKNIVLDLLGILVALPGARMFNLRTHLVRYISELLEGNRDPTDVMPLLSRVMSEPDEFNEFDIWRFASKLISQNRDNQMIFPFLQLPREIRSKIYIYACENGNPSFQDQYSVAANKISAYHPSNPKKRLAILRANHQTHSEGTKDLFDNFVVHAGNLGVLHRVLNSFSQTTKSRLRSLDVCDITMKQTGALAFRLSDRKLSSIRNLRIEGVETYTGPWYFRPHGLSEYDKWPQYDKKLEAAVCGLFERNERMNFIPSLELCNFDGLPSENVTFPERWNVSITTKAPAGSTYHAVYHDQTV